MSISKRKTLLRRRISFAVERVESSKKKYRLTRKKKLEQSRVHRVSKVANNAPGGKSVEAVNFIKWVFFFILIESYTKVKLVDN